MCTIMGQGYLLYEIERLLGKFQQEDTLTADGGAGAELLTCINEASEVFKAHLSNAVFRLRKEKQVCLLIEKYHHALVLLLDELLESRSTAAATGLLEMAYTIVDGLLHFVEKRFSNYLNPETELGPQYITLSQKDWPGRLAVLEGRLQGSAGETLFRFVSESLMRFINARRHRHMPLRALLYRKELIAEIEILTGSVKMARLPQSLHEVLLYMNFNSRGYLEYYTRELAAVANECEGADERAGYLQKRYKKFRRLYCNTLIGLHPEKENIKAMISGWFEAQLQLDAAKKLPLVMPYGKAFKGLTLPPSPRAIPKISCTLSGPQLGIVLRAADQAQVIRAPSLSSIFKAVVPYLSTPNTKDLSADSVRSKSYLFDEKDRQETIGILEHLIEKIKQL
jgi:hypothetical protein